MKTIENTVFIGYRRTNGPWALLIYKYLTNDGYDVFFDYESINSGDYERIIFESIRVRAHFLILLTPSALERCKEPNDLFRREIEFALNNKKNIVPICLEGFDFSEKAVIDCLIGGLERVQKYSSLTLSLEYFDAGMEKLRSRFLNIPIEKVMHPISSKTKQVVDEQKQVIAKQAFVNKNTLSARGWFEKAYKSNLPKEKVRLYTKAIELDPNFIDAYINRGNSYQNLKQYKKAIENYDQAIKLDPKFAFAYNNRGYSFYNLKQDKEAIEDYNQAIKLDPEFALAYNNRGLSFYNLKQYKKAFKDYNQAIKLDPECVFAYNNRGNSYHNLKQYEKAIENYNQAIKLDPEHTFAYNNRGNSYRGLKQYKKAIKNYNQAIRLDPKFGLAYYNKACLYAVQGNKGCTLQWLKKALQIDSKRFFELIITNSDFDDFKVDNDFQNLINEFDTKK